MNGFAEAGEQDPGGTGPDLRVLFVRGVVRSFPWVLLLTLLGALAGIVVGLLQPNSYLSNAKLSFRMGAREQLTAESLVELDEQQQVPPLTMVDELQLLSDAAIFERVARELGPGVILRPADPQRDDGPRTPASVRLFHWMQSYVFRPVAETRPEQSEEDLRSATKLLKKNTAVSNEPGSSVILVSHTSTSPELAHKIVQALTGAFIERHREQFSIESLLEKSRGQLEKARQARDEAAKSYVEHVSRSGIAELEMQVPRLAAEVTLLERELFEARVRREEIAQLRIALSNRLQGVPYEIEVLRPSVMIPNEEYETQLTLKRMLLAQKQEMLIETRPSEELRRREKEFANQIAKIDLKLEETPKTVAQGSEMQENLGHAALEARLVDLEVDNETLSLKLDLLESRLTEKRSRMSELQERLLTATLLWKDLGSVRDGEETRYTRLLERFSMLEALEKIDLDEEANLRVLQAPTLEYEKLGPLRGSLLLKGLLAGMSAAIAFAMLRQHFERRLSHPEIFEHARGVPVISVVPHLSSLRRLEERGRVGVR